MSVASPDLQRGPARFTAPERVIVALSVSTFVEWAGAGCVMPLLPLYLRKLGAPVALVGVVMAAFFLAAILVQYPIGRLSDRIGRRPVQLGGLVTFAVASAAFALIGTPIAALFVRGLQGAGAGVVDVANNATVGEVVSPSQQGRAYGTLFGSRTVGLAIGPFIGGLVGISGMRWLFVAAALASLLACVPVLIAVPKTGSRHRTCSAPRVVLWRDRSVLGVVMGYAGAGLVIGVYEVCWSLLLHLRGATGWQIGLSWTLFAVPFAAMSVPGGWLVDHFDRRYLAGGVDAHVGRLCVHLSVPSFGLAAGGSRCGRGRDGGGRRAGARVAACAQRSEPPARARPRSRFDGSDGRDRRGGPRGGRTVRVASLGARSWGRRARSSCWWRFFRGAGGACPAGTSARATRVEARSASAGGISARPGPGPAGDPAPIGRVSGGDRLSGPALALSQPGAQDPTAVVEAVEEVPALLGLAGKLGLASSRAAPRNDIRA